jgi:hypothetical protein
VCGSLRCGIVVFFVLGFTSSGPGSATSSRISTKPFDEAREAKLYQWRRWWGIEGEGGERGEDSGTRLVKVVVAKRISSIKRMREEEAMKK